MDMSDPIRPRLQGPPRLQMLRVVLALVVREMSATYGSSLGGYFWAVAQPLGGVTLLAVVFGLALHTPPLGTNFMMFYATGMIPITFFLSMSREVASTVATNRGLLSYPVVGVREAMLAKIVVNLVTNGLIALLLFGGIIILGHIHVVPDFAAILLGLGLSALLGAGMGALNCVLFGFFPTWKNIWGVLTKPLFLISGVFFLLETVPRDFHDLLWINPLIHTIGITRQGFYREYDPHYVSYALIVGVGLSLFVIGAYLMRRHEAALIERK